MADALLIMFLGMGGVFLFLIVLILVMQMIVALFPPNESDARPAARAPQLAQAAATDQTLIAVLQAAVVAYEADNKQP